MSCRHMVIRGGDGVCLWLSKVRYISSLCQNLIAWIRSISSMRMLVVMSISSSVRCKSGGMASMDLVPAVHFQGCPAAVHSSAAAAHVCTPALEQDYELW